MASTNEQMTPKANGYCRRSGQDFLNGLFSDPEKMSKFMQDSRAASKGNDLSDKELYRFDDSKDPFPSSSFTSTKNHEPGPHRTLNKKDSYSEKALTICENGVPPPKQSKRCTCQADIQELQEAFKKISDDFVRLTHKFEQASKELNTMAQDARVHREDTQRLIAAANGGNTPTDSEEDASDASADGERQRETRLW
ncbi:hypothetical protein MKX08_009824 [Trichoderma sp. CBMAI-0020]|nr:hypothetical protein MKX08_009824 [Trichoderma sp. CBMAI-0020]